MDRSALKPDLVLKSTGGGTVGVPSGRSDAKPPGPVEIVEFDAAANPLLFLADWINQYGNTIHYRTRFGPCYLFVDPEDVQTITHSENFRRAGLVKIALGEGLLTSDGPWWRSQRRLMQRDFLPAQMPPFGPIISDETSRLADAWHDAVRTGEVVDVAMAMTRLTLRIIVRALFSDDLSEADSTALCNAITRLILDLGAIARTTFGVAFNFTPETISQITAGKQEVDLICFEMIHRRQAMARADRPRDLLTLLVEARTDAVPLTDIQLRDEIVTMLIGGHETTALALSWAWKELSQAPASEAKLFEESQRLLGGRIPTYDDVPKLTWASAVFQESLRLYPPVWFITRVPIKDDIVGGYPIPRNACVVVAPYFTHRDKDIWPEPEKFMPARFVEPAAKLPHRYAYFPFNGGRHQCLGMHFALMEGAMILAQLSQSFRLSAVNGDQVKPSSGITLRQTPSLLATLHHQPGVA